MFLITKFNRETFDGGADYKGINTFAFAIQSLCSSSMVPKNSAIFVGINLSSLIIVSSFFYQTNQYQQDKNTKYLGQLGGYYDVYLDLRIDPNEVRIGGKDEILRIELKKERKNKLKKINIYK